MVISVESHFLLPKTTSLSSSESKSTTGPLAKIASLILQNHYTAEKKDDTYYYCVNSASYYWAGSKYTHDTYDKQISEEQESYGFINHISYNKVLAVSNLQSFMDCPSNMPSASLAIKINGS